jgi:hypothetical protein
MKNDMTWERSASSELDKQQATRSHGKLAILRSKTSALSSGSQSKTPVPCSPLPVPNSSGKTPFPIPHHPSPIPINKETILTLLRRKNYLVKQIVKLREGPLDEKAWIYREANALTSMLNFIWLMLKTVPHEQLEKLRNLQRIEDGLLPNTLESIKLRIPDFHNTVREALGAFNSG